MAYALQEEGEEDLCIRCGSQMVNIGFKIYRCQNCGHEEKPEDVA
jgi:tRNA(Ile2) C34 agmatinyltransferase TiaS